MDDGFDPYYEWLGIPARDQPPNWYRLLGIERFEANANVIERAADRQMGHLRTFQSGGAREGFAAAAQRGVRGADWLAVARTQDRLRRRTSSRV